MGKSMSIQKEKDSSYIPQDLVHSILSKLPLKSLRRFRIVCKLWSFLFENTYFMSMYCNKFLSNNHSYYDDASLLVYINKAGNPDNRFYQFKQELYMLYGERFENKIKIEWPIPFHDDYPGLSILGSSSINGILCLYRPIRTNQKVIFWNPATKEFKIIPSSPNDELGHYHDELHGFGYDILKHDYKVIRHIRLTLYSDDDNLEDASKYISYKTFWEIYSLQSNSWRKLDINMPTCTERYKVYMDGVCHWLDLGDTYDDEERLVSFNMSNEMFVTKLMPPDMNVCSSMRLSHKRLVVLNGYIAMISNYLQKTTFHILILGEIGVKESWTKLFTVGPLSFVEHSIGIWKNGNTFFRKKDNELVWFDKNTKKMEKVGLKSQEHFGDIITYKKCYCSIEGINS